MPIPKGKAGNGRMQPTIDELAIQREQDARILGLALSGKNGVQIAAEVGVDKSTVTRTLQRVWARTEQPMAHELRAKWDLRIEAALAGIWDRVIDGDTQAVHAFCRLQEQAAKLHGLNQQFANDAGALAEALLADPEQRLQEAIKLRDELAEIQRRREEAAAQ